MIDLHWLNVFRNVYECRSFSRAGELLALSQPTVSAHVASLEKATGARLFERFGRQVIPTQAGERLYHRSVDIFLHLESLEHDLQGSRHKNVGRVRVFASTFPGHCLVPAYLAIFLRTYPHITAQLQISDTAAVNTAVADGLCSFGFAGAALECDTLMYAKIFDDELILVAAPFFLEGKKKETHEGIWICSMQALLDMPWVMRPVGSATRTIFIQALSAQGASPRDLKIRAEGFDSQSVLALVRQGVGMAAISRLAALPLLERGELQEIRVKDMSMRRPIYILRNKCRRLLTVEQLFWDFVVALDQKRVSDFLLHPAGAPFSRT